MFKFMTHFPSTRGVRKGNYDRKHICTDLVFRHTPLFQRITAKKKSDDSLVS